MSQVLVTESYLQDIANAIRSKNGLLTQYTPGQMADAIEAIVVSEGGHVLCGTSNPSSSEGENEDLYVKYYQAPSDYDHVYGIDSIYRKVSGAWVAYTEPVAPYEIVPFASGTDAQIGALIDAARAGIINLHDDAGWSIGDKRSIACESFTGYNGATIAAQNVEIAISSFSDYNNCGCVMQFDFTKGFSGNLAYHVGSNYSTDSNAGGYAETNAYKSQLNNIVGALPSWLKDRLLTFDVLSSRGSGSQTIDTIGNNKLAFRSEVEITGNHSHSVDGEGSQIEFYQTSANRIKKKSNGTAVDSPLRSPLSGSAYSFVYIWSNGTVDALNSSGNYVLYAPFGCL